MQAFWHNGFFESCVWVLCDVFFNDCVAVESFGPPSHGLPWATVSWAIFFPWNPTGYIFLRSSATESHGLPFHGLEAHYLPVVVYLIFVM